MKRSVNWAGDFIRIQPSDDWNDWNGWNCWNDWNTKKL
jgi:hypothetical protein